MTSRGNNTGSGDQRSGNRGHNLPSSGHGNEAKAHASDRGQKRSLPSPESTVSPTHMGPLQRSRRDHETETASHRRVEQGGYHPSHPANAPTGQAVLRAFPPTHVRRDTPLAATPTQMHPPDDGESLLQALLSSRHASASNASYPSMRTTEPAPFHDAMPWGGSAVPSRSMIRTVPDSYPFQAPAASPPLYSNSMPAEEAYQRLIAASRSDPTGLERNMSHNVAPSSFASAVVPHRPGWGPSERSGGATDWGSTLYPPSQPFQPSYQSQLSQYPPSMPAHALTSGFLSGVDNSSRFLAGPGTLLGGSASLPFRGGTEQARYPAQVPHEPQSHLHQHYAQLPQPNVYQHDPPVPRPVLLNALAQPVSAPSSQERLLYESTGLRSDVGYASLLGLDTVPYQPSLAPMYNPAASSSQSRGLPRTLAHPDDKLILSSHQVLLRHQIQVFEATLEDTVTHTRGRNKLVRVGQVGIRCKHCVNIDPSKRQKGSMYFPATTMGLYQASQNMSTTHLQCGLCIAMPDTLKEHFAALIPSKATGSLAGRPYWAKSAKEMGLIDTDDGIRYLPP